MSAGQIYGIYFAWVFGIGVAMFFPYNLLRQEKSEQGRTKLVLYAGIFGGCFLLQFLVVLFTVIAASTHSDDTSIVNSFLYSQIRYNGAPKAAAQDCDPMNGQAC